MLKVKDLSVNYGGIRALRGVSLEVPAGKIVTLIGGERRGKEQHAARDSRARQDLRRHSHVGREASARPAAEDVLARGVALCPEGRRIFPHLTVLENLQLGGYGCRTKEELEAGIERAFTLFPRLRSVRGRRAARSRAESSRCSRSGAR